MSRRLEIGGDFHWMGLPAGEGIPWRQPNSQFSLGRDGVSAVWDDLPTDEGRRLFVPDYFCQEVADAWAARGIRIARYRDDPTLSEPKWDDLGDVGAGDLVMAVNFFGVREPGGWYEWLAGRDGTLLIEDHSHDPLSRWAVVSQAHYAFASLRKVLPVPDGGLLWSPAGYQLPHAEGQASVTGSALKLAAMVWKMEYLAGRGGDPTGTKAVFRDLQLRGERHLVSGSKSEPAPWSRPIIQRGYPPEWRARREANVSRLLELISGRIPADPLFSGWPEGSCPLTAAFVFRTPQLRERARAALIGTDIYPTVLWPLGLEAGAEAGALSARVLCLPSDQRYGAADIDTIADALSHVDWREHGG